jgi:hypothetical protein
MSRSLQTAEKHNEQDAAIRNVVGFAHEVRLHLHDSKVIFATVVPVGDGDSDAFLIRPWGLRSPMTVRYDQVYRAAPVKQMGWTKHRSISAAQLAGVFTESASRQAQ